MLNTGCTELTWWLTIDPDEDDVEARIWHDPTVMTWRPSIVVRGVETELPLSWAPDYWGESADSLEVAHDDGTALGFFSTFDNVLDWLARYLADHPEMLPAEVRPKVGA